MDLDSTRNEVLYLNDTGDGYIPICCECPEHTALNQSKAFEAQSPAIFMPASKSGPDLCCSVTHRTPLCTAKYLK